ncbi:MAG: alpha/beta fold hydrolase [Pseudomonadota bacterium]|nr:alpha/beta fold hydrolase [Pseudomonadota bacterium]
MNRWAFLLASFLLLPIVSNAGEPEGPVAPASPVASAERGEARVDVSVFYVTNRRRDEDKPAAYSYGGERGEPHFGRCEVTFTPIPIINQVASKVPFYLPSETNEVLVAEQADARVFWDQLATAVDQTSTGSVVLFVHGYNYGFERTCRMAAEMQRALRGEAIVLMFSWPSNGLPTDYVHDQADVEWSVPFLADMLVQLGERIGPRNLRVLAHSLGSRGIVFALQRLRAELEKCPVIGRLVLLAPDFDSQTFVDLLPGLVPLTGGITLYASSHDTPLKVSRQLSGYPRLGEGGEHLTVVQGMETVDVSPAGRYQILGHEYFYFHPLVEADLVTLLSTGAGAAERSGLRPNEQDGVGYWEIAGDSRP